MNFFGLPTIILTTVVLSVGFFLFGLWQPSIPGRWCAENQEWQTCYREWISALAGYVALLVGAVSIFAIREQIQATKELAQRADDSATTARIARFRAAMEVSIPYSERLRATGGTLSDLFIQWPELLTAENDSELKAVQKEIKAFNTSIGDYVSLPASAQSARVDDTGQSKQAKLSGKLDGLKSTIEGHVDGLLRSRMDEA